MICEKNVPSHFEGTHIIPEEKLKKAINKALDKLSGKIEIYKHQFPSTSSENYKYPLGDNGNWICGMHTGCFLIAYELSGDEKFLDVAKAHMATYKDRVERVYRLGDHDVGFVFSPSCVAMYKLTGDESAKQTALKAAEILYNKSYSQKGGFIIRAANSLPEEWACRTMVDTMFNIPLLYWASEETGDEKYKNAANSQVNITKNLLVRSDGSSYHHYQFDVDTHKPIKGITNQGRSDESTWSRGQGWCIAGFPIAYSYNGDKSLLDVQRRNVHYMLNHLPKDNLPYWDYDFISGDEPRDSSAGVISACGMMEALKYIPNDSEDAITYKNVSAKLLEAVIDNCTGDIGIDYDGLICHVTHAAPGGLGIDECAVYGDYFYLEALLRYINPNWKRYW